MLLSKVFLVLVYQMALSLIVLALFGAFSGNVSLLLYTLSGASLAFEVGLLLGTMLETAGAAGGLEAVAIFAFIIPAIFVPLTPYLGGNAIAQIIEVLPTYYVAEGVCNALHN